MTLAVSDVEIPIKDGNVVLWRVTGIAGVRYPTKIAAELASRQRFPYESIHSNYARVYFERFVLDF